LGAAKVRFDPPAQLHEPHDLRIRQCRQPLAVWLYPVRFGATRRRRIDRQPLGRDHLGDHRVIPHLVNIGVHEA